MDCFVIRGFGRKKDSAGQEIDFDAVEKALIAPAMEASGLTGGTTITVMDAGSIHDDMFRLILKADIVVCDITVHNANVFYELGVRHALRRQHTVLIRGDKTADGTPFDIAGMRYLTYKLADPGDGEVKKALTETLKATLATERETDSPVFLMMPELPDADVDSIVVVPLAFLDRVKLASARSDAAALQALAVEARGQRYARDALKIIGRAQWAMNDFDAAVGTWQRVLEGAASDLAANLALGNLYERQYKRSKPKDPTLLERSNQAIDRALKRKFLSPAQKAEAQALQGRNLKTLWRRGFDGLETVEERRAQAVDDLARKSYEAYLAAHKTDLNHFFPGLAALQMGHILLSLSQEAGFANLFGGDADDASLYVNKLRKALAAQEHVVRAAIQRALTLLQGEPRVWADISGADLLFITQVADPAGPNAGAVLQAYRTALRDQEAFFWDACRGQLELFEQLDIGAAVARTVIQALNKPAA